MGHKEKKVKKEGKEKKEKKEKKDKKEKNERHSSERRERKEKKKQKKARKEALKEQLLQNDASQETHKDVAEKTPTTDDIAVKDETPLLDAEDETSLLDAKDETLLDAKEENALLEIKKEIGLLEAEDENALLSVKHETALVEAPAPVKVKIKEEARTSQATPELQLTVKTEKRAKQVKPKKKKITREEDIEPKHPWWEDVDEDGEIRHHKVNWWQLEHHAYLFPDSYVPHRVPLIYDNTKIVLCEEAEEIASCYVSAIGTDHEKKERFIANFWEAFIDHMNDSEKARITDFEKCDFSLIRANLLEERERNKARSKEEKEAESRSRLYYQYALVNGFREKVGSYRVEPPQLFRGRGEHPMQGKLKYRVPPEDCVLNCDPDAPAPRVPPNVYPGHCWKDIIHDDSVTWLGYYDQTFEKKYFFLAASSGIKGRKDLFKYEKARRLHAKIESIRRDYKYKVERAKDLQLKQLGTATFLIDHLALRVGGEKDTDQEADTVGCTSLRVEHITLDPNSTKVTLDFLGKDSVRYLNELDVPQGIYDRIKEFMRGKNPADKLFDTITPSVINEYFKEFMPDLTTKVFRTYNASVCLEKKLATYDHAKHGSSSSEIESFYTEANKSVAVLCNHQKGVAKTHGDAIQKLGEKLDNIRVEMCAVREQLARLNVGENRGMRDGDPFTRLPTSVLSCKKRIKALRARAMKISTEMTSKESNKTLSLTTSKYSYMDPRITVSFCKRVGLEVRTVFNSAVLSKFPWAQAVSPDFKFQTEKVAKFSDALKEAQEAMEREGIDGYDKDSDEDGGPIIKRRCV